jgi:hypothetical protein
MLGPDEVDAIGGVGEDEARAGEAAEGWEQREVFCELKAGCADDAACGIGELDARVNVPGEAGFVGGASGRCVKEPKWADRKAFGFDGDPKVGRRRARAAVVIAGHEINGEVRAARAPCAESAQGFFVLACRVVEKVPQDQESRWRPEVDRCGEAEEIIRVEPGGDGHALGSKATCFSEVRVREEHHAGLLPEYGALGKEEEVFVVPFDFEHGLDIGCVCGRRARKALALL